MQTTMQIHQSASILSNFNKQTCKQAGQLCTQARNNTELVSMRAGNVHHLVDPCERIIVSIKSDLFFKHFYVILHMIEIRIQS